MSIFFIFKAEARAQGAVYTKGSLSVSFSGVKTYSNTSGSDNWPVTWASDDNQYTSWGDGNGFSGPTRVSIGVGRITGSSVGTLSGTNIWSGSGKSYGMLEVDGVLNMWVCGTASDGSAYDVQKLYRSTNYKTTNSASFSSVNWEFNKTNGGNFFCPTFLQFGKAYSGAPDGYVYIYAPKIDNSNWEVQPSGEIFLLRVPKADIANRSSYQFYSGTVGGGSSAFWTTDINAKKAVFKDEINGVMRTSVTYNAGLGRYILTTQQISRNLPGSYIGIYDAPNPWGPWTTVLFTDARSAGLQGAEGKTVFWNFSNKWTSLVGKNSVMIYTGNDILATATATFTNTSSPLPTKTPTPTPKPTGTNTPTPSINGDANGDGFVDEVDYSIWKTYYNQTVTGGVIKGDFNLNGKVDGVDYLIWLHSSTG